MATAAVLCGLLTVEHDVDHRPINIYPDAVPPINAVSSHAATDKDPSK